jgi:endonuclease YncB( thermonuclease family)
VVWNYTKTGKARQYCPDCRGEKEFSESRLDIVKGQMPDPIDTPMTTSSSGFPGFFGGVILGGIVALAASVFSGFLVPPADPPSTSKTRIGKTPMVIPSGVKVVTPNGMTVMSKYGGVKTPTGEHAIAQPEHFLMHDKVFTVMKVIDGDTMHITELPNNAKVRLLGVDTPETKHATKGIQFWGKEASAFTKDLLNGQKVIIQIDIKHQYGVFGRPLVFLEMIDGRDFNALLISEGYARCTREYPFNRMKEYTQLEDTAKAEKKGMWNDAARKVFDQAKARAKAAAKAAERLAQQKEVARREKLVAQAIGKGGRYVRSSKSRTVHEPWCTRKPKKSVLYFPDLQRALNEGCKKHSCFK